MSAPDAGAGPPAHEAQAPAAPAIDSPASFAAAVHWGVAQAVARGARRIVFVDRDFAAWPLDEPSLIDALGAWLRRPQRELVLLGATFDEVPRRHPRFLSWRRYWQHVVPAWQAPEEARAGLPTLLLDDGPVLVQLLDGVHWRGRAGLDAQAAHLQREEVDALLQRSAPGLAVNWLGL